MFSSGIICHYVILFFNNIKIFSSFKLSSNNVDLLTEFWEFYLYFFSFSYTTFYQSLHKSLLCHNSESFYPFFQVKSRYPTSQCYLKQDRLYVDNRMFVWNTEESRVVEQAVLTLPATPGNQFPGLNLQTR
jgi:hypothetical protein